MVAFVLASCEIQILEPGIKAHGALVVLGIDDLRKRDRRGVVHFLYFLLLLASSAPSAFLFVLPLRFGHPQIHIPLACPTVF